MLDKLTFFMKKKYIKAIFLLFGIIVALYVTGLRILTFVFEMGLKTEKTDTIRNLLVFNIPDFISVLFCFSIVVYLIKKINWILRNS